MSNILTATNIELRYNDLVVLAGASLSIDERDRIGMVGRNGAGKSTFLRILAGLQKPDAGEITQRRDLIVSYLPQQFALELDLTVEENVRAGAAHVQGLIDEFESLPPHTGRHDELETRIEALEGWTLDHRIAAALDHLHCPPAWQRVAELSGGEQRRVALCRALVSRPDLLILDEPTNHLDTEAIEWMVNFLDRYPGAFLVVTHDRYFLDRITQSIVELSQGATCSYGGNYTDYLLAKAEREAAAETVEHKRQMFLRRELEWVRRGPKARTTKSKARLDQYFAVAGRKGLVVDKDIELVIPPPPPLGNRVVELAKVGMQYGERELFSDLNLNFAASDRVGVTGANGLGKTTLLKIILGQVEPARGTVRIGELTRFNYVDQGRMQLDEERTVLEEMSDGTEFVLFGDQSLSLRGYLKRFLFTDDRITTRVKHLSGGERSRLLLARILKNGGNFLMLDEPTNDLDMATLRILEEALVAFPGVVLVVSHDRYFLNRVCTHILAFEGEGRVHYHVGDYDSYVEWRARQPRRATEPQSGMNEPASPPAKTASVRPRKLSFKEKRELDAIEPAIQAAEEEIARIEATFIEPDFHRKHGQRTNELTARLGELKQQVANLYARWEELEAIES